VVILPILSDSDVIMIRNERFIVDECLWELPAGTLEPGETPLETACREIIEETGYQAKEMSPLFEFYSTPGFCNEKIHTFVAKDLSYMGQHLDPTEEIAAEAIPWTKVMSMIRDGSIHDGKTIATLLFYASFNVV
jgi:ADP-ribose pyrophosphatase